MTYIESSKRVFLAIVGASGSGKTTLVNKLCNEPLFSRPICYTTRQRREGENDEEYKFVSHDEFERLYQIRFQYFDDVHGNKYSTDAVSVESILLADKVPVKEIAADNVSKLKSSLSVYPIVVQLTGSFLSRPGRQESVSELSREFPVLKLATRGQTLEQLALTVGNFVRGTLRLMDSRGVAVLNQLALASQEDSTGYDLVAPYFSDELRITTRYFHSVSSVFWASVIPSLHGRVLEIGPGRGWLRSAFEWPQIDYNGLDYSSEMIRRNPEAQKIRLGRLDDLDLDKSYDFIVGSLIDPLLTPAHMIHVRRLLKNGGRFIATAPAGEWADALRALRGLDAGTTKFSLPSGSATVPSIGLWSSELSELLHAVGFAQVRLTPLISNHLPAIDCPPDIKSVIDRNEVEFPVVHCWEAI